MKKQFGITAIFLQLFLLLNAQDSKWIIKEGSNYILKNNLSGNIKYDTILIVPGARQYSNYLEGNQNKNTGFYIGIKNWKKEYFNFMDYAIVNGYEKEKFRMPIFQNVKMDLIPFNGKLSDDLKDLDDVYLRFQSNNYTYGSFLDTIGKSLNLFLRGDSLMMGSFLIIKKQSKKYLVDFEGKLVLNYPIDSLKPIGGADIHCLHAGNRVGYIFYSGSVIKPEYDIVLQKQIDFPKNPNYREKNYTNIYNPNINGEGDIDSHQFEHVGTIDGVYVRVQEGFFAFKNAVISTESYTADTIYIEGDNYRLGYYKSKSKVIKEGFVDIYDNSGNKINDEAYDNIKFIHFTNDSIYFRTELTISEVYNLPINSLKLSWQAIIVGKGSKYGVISKDFKKIINCEYDIFYCGFTQNQNYLIGKKEFKFDVLDFEGRKINKIPYDSIWFYSVPDSNWFTPGLNRGFEEFVFIKSGKKTGVMSLTDGHEISLSTKALLRFPCTVKRV